MTGKVRTGKVEKRAMMKGRTTRMVKIRKKIRMVLIWKTEKKGEGKREEIKR